MRHRVVRSIPTYPSPCAGYHTTESLPHGTSRQYYKAISSVLLFCVIASCSIIILAADAWEVMLCMYGNASGNGGGSEYHSAE